MTQTSQLKAVTPRTLISGFSIELKRRNNPVVEHWSYETLVVDYYFEVTVICDGTNNNYPQTEFFTVLVSQLVDTCDLEFVSNCPVLMLKQNERLTAITVQLGKMENLTGVWLVFTILDYYTNEETVQGYLFKPD